MATPAANSTPVKKAVAPQRAQRPDSFSQRLHTFWHRVTEGLALADLWTQFKTEAQTGYRLYSREVDTDELAGASRGQRFRFVAKSLFWAILDKLSPARRVVLLVSVILLFTPVSLHLGDASVETSTLHILGGLIILALLLMEIADRVTLKRDLQIAREIQLWLVPEKAPEIPGLDVAFFNRPANTVAGDYYDVFQRTAVDGSPGPMLLTVADVAGKSLPAALLMATLQASLHTLSAQRGSLMELTAGLNRYACDHSRGGQRFTTAFLAEYDPMSGQLNYINAGHNAPILRRADGTMERLDVGGLPLGITPMAPYQSGSVLLQAGDVLVIFTDGLVEAVNDSGAEYSEERLTAAICGNCMRTAQDMVAGMIRALDIFVGTTPQHDDITCLVARKS